MKSIALICFLGLSAFAAAASDNYPDKYDGVDIDEILSNKRLIESYLKCILNKGPCTPEGIEINGNMKEAVQNYCKRCTDKQFELVKRLTKLVIKEYPDYWNEMKKVFDPESKYIEGWLKRLEVE